MKEKMSMNVMMPILDFFYFLVDLPAKVKIRYLTKFKGLSIFTSTKKSDSDSTPYSDFVSEASINLNVFSNFRKNYSYRIILEHVDYKLGADYLRRLDPNYLAHFAHEPFFTKMSQVGSPRVFYYPGLGWVSPTLIRYLYVNQSLLELFEPKDIISICEIGVGFGGQCAISIDSLRPKTYALYDLPVVLDLTDKFLTELEIDKTVIARRDINQLTSETFDLVISNYAFSELPALIQDDYLTNILSKAKCGYLTMNSGRTNYSGRSPGKLSLDEIINRIPGSEVLEESPLTGPDNYIIIWGHKKG